MLMFVLEPATANATIRTPREMLEANELAGYAVRDNGRYRRVQLLPVESTARQTAEWIFDQYEDGRSVSAIARELFVSTATVRRFLEALELTEQVEAGEWDEEWAVTHGLPYIPNPDELGMEELAAVFNGEWAGPVPTLLAENGAETVTEALEV